MRNCTVSSGILRKWLSHNGRRCVFSKCEGEIVEKMGNFAVTMCVKHEACPAFAPMLRRGKPARRDVERKE